MRVLGAQTVVSHQSIVPVQHQQSKERDLRERFPITPFDISTEGKVNDLQGHDLTAVTA